MKIIVKDSDTNLTLRLPSQLILNGITASLIPKIINSKLREKTNGVELNFSSKQLRPLIREINRYRRKHRDWVLIEVEGASKGEKVVVKP